MSKFFKNLSWLSIGLAIASICGFVKQAHASSGEKCLYAAADEYRVNVDVLRAILWTESRFNPQAINKNTNGTRDFGIGQINSIHMNTLLRNGVTENQLLDMCTGIHVAAWVLATQMARYGNTWFAVGAYHSATPALNESYVKRIKTTLRQWKVLTSHASRTAVK